MRGLYLALLGREADAAGLAHFVPRLAEGEPLETVLEALTQSAEFRTRMRSGPVPIGPAEAALLWPLETRPYTIQIVLSTGDGVDKVRRVLRGLSKHLHPREIVTVLTPHAAPPDEPLPPGIEVVTVPGASVFHLRAEIPRIAKEAGWIILIEDHNILSKGWLRNLRRGLRETPPGVDAISGTLTNEHSTTPWGWANFLHTFAFHWHPVTSLAHTPLAANGAFRRDLFPARALPVGTFETTFLTIRAQISNQFPTDHAQSKNFFEATATNFNNGRASGALTHLVPKDRRARISVSIRQVLGKRFRGLRDAVRAHPNYGDIPRGSFARVRWLSLCHAFGMLVGYSFGAGRSFWRLE